MGYHIIISNEQNGIDSQYIENIEELAFIDNLTTNTIIYEGERHWTPVSLGAEKNTQVILRIGTALESGHNIFLRH